MTFLLGKYLKKQTGSGKVKKMARLRDRVTVKWSFFYALPAGYSNGGTSNNMGTNAYFWSATENSATNAWNRNLNTGNGQSNRNNNNKTNGFSVRCLQNSSRGCGVQPLLSLNYKI
jgi:uncharacterized protein (TIGR02145 family)